MPKLTHSFRKALVVAILISTIPWLAGAVLVFVIRDKVVDWWFRFRNSQKIYIVCSRRHDWYDFLVNNVVPVLPPSMSLVWFEPASGKVRGRAFPASIRKALRDRDRPALVVVTRGAFRLVPLHQELSKWKPFARRSAAVQSHVRRILDAAQTDLITS